MVIVGAGRLFKESSPGENDVGLLPDLQPLQDLPSLWLLFIILGRLLAGCTHPLIHTDVGAAAAADATRWVRCGGND